MPTASHFNQWFPNLPLEMNSKGLLKFLVVNLENISSINEISNLSNICTTSM